MLAKERINHSGTRELPNSLFNWGKETEGILFMLEKDFNLSSSSERVETIGQEMLYESREQSGECGIIDFGDEISNSSVSDFCWLGEECEASNSDQLLGGEGLWSTSFSTGTEDEDEGQDEMLL